MKLSAPIFRLKRQAKLLSRREAIPLHEAQDRIARREGYQRWSQLAADHSERPVAEQILARLAPGELVLLAGQREQGKTTLAFELMAEAITLGRAARYFSLAENGVDVERRLDGSGVDPARATELFFSDTSDEISATYIVDRCGDPAPGTLIVVDYLQLLDQQRHKPVLADQVDTLRTFAQRTGVTVVLISQIDRSFDLSGKTMPEPEHLRLPNPVDLTHIATSCFIHNGEVEMHATV